MNRIIYLPFGQKFVVHPPMVPSSLQVHVLQLSYGDATLAPGEHPTKKSMENRNVKRYNLTRII